MFVISTSDYRRKKPAKKCKNSAKSNKERTMKQKTFIIYFNGATDTAVFYPLGRKRLESITEHLK